MSSSVVARLVMKDVYLYRLLIAAALLVGIPSVLITPINMMTYAVGGMFYLTTVIAYGVIIVMYGVVQERKEKAMLFAMSLPVSHMQYLQSKLLAAFITFFIPWLILTLTALILIVTMDRLPNGLASYLTLVAFYMLLNFSVVLGIALRTRSEVGVGATIIITNLSVSLFFMGMATNQEINAITRGATIAFNTEMLWILAVEIGLLPIALSVPFWFRGNKGDVL